MDNKLLLAVNFLGIDKLSGSIRNIMTSGRQGASSLKALKDEARSLERQLEGVRQELGSATGNITHLVTRERELERAIKGSNLAFAEQKRQIQRVAALRAKADAIAQRAGSIGMSASLFVTAPVLAFGAASIRAAREAAMASAQTKASIASMGAVAGRTYDQLANQASDLMRQSLYDDDEILRKVTANMLTFGKVSGTTFDRAQLAAVNLSAKLGTDLQSSALMVGKALNDPVKGMLAMTRAGVSFTAAQRDMIKAMVDSGNAAGAQLLILSELDKQFGGSAKAARQADPGAAAAIDIGEFQQAIGEKLLPKLLPLVGALSRMLDAFNKLSPGTQDLIVNTVLLGAAFGPVMSIFSGAAGMVRMFASPIMMLVTRFPMLNSLLGLAGRTVLSLGGAFLRAGLMMLANPMVLAIVAVVGALYLLYSNWDKVKAAGAAAWNWIKAAWDQAPAFMKSIGSAMMDGLLLALNPVLMVTRMLQIAKAGVAAFKGYFGIKSPSRLMMQMGGHIATGLGHGIDRGGQGPLKSMTRLATGVAGAAAISIASPSLASAGSPARGAANAGASTVTYNVTIQLPAGADAANPRQAALAIKRELDQLLAIEGRGSYTDG